MAIERGVFRRFCATQKRQKILQHNPLLGIRGLKFANLGTVFTFRSTEDITYDFFLQMLTGWTAFTEIYSVSYIFTSALQHLYS